VVEYAGVLTAVSLLALSVGGQLAGRSAAVLPSTNAAALELVVAGARAEKVPVAKARAAYARAPYAKPVERYLYAAGWIGGAKNRASCLLTRLGQSSAERAAASELRTRPKVMKQLRGREISALSAASALVKGVVSACS